MRVTTVYTPMKTTTMQFGLCILGKGRLYLDSKEIVDLWTSQPEKTLQTPMFDQASMEVKAEADVEIGKSYEITVLSKNEAVVPALGALSAGGLRIGCCEKMDPAAALAEAVKLAKSVDVPIVIAGLNADYESEALDRKDPELPVEVNKLIEKVV